MSYDARHVENSGRGAVSGTSVYGGLGTGADAIWSGKVASLDRGTDTSNEKVPNVQPSGGLACIVANNADGGFVGTLGDGNSATIPDVSIGLVDGSALKTQVGAAPTVSSTLTPPATNGYDAFDAMSMATPHFSAAAVSSPGNDSTPSVISNLAATTTNAKNGSCDIAWATDEPATTDLQLNGALSLNSTRTTTHNRSTRGTQGATYL